MAWDKAEVVGNEFSNETLVELFLSSLGTDNTANYSILHTNLENQCADGQNSYFVDIELKFIQLEECNSSSAFSCHKRAI
jgi:hypothetical protein